VTIVLSAALAGESNSNAALHNGDVLSIRERAGWNDLGASITVKGEVKHPGTYGIRPGEKLSAIMERAGGFQPDAYTYGVILEREEVRELQKSSQDAMILRVKDVEDNLELLPESNPKQKEAKEMALQQWRVMLQQLNTNPPVGRVAIHISTNINRWKNTSSDMEVRAGDILIVPKKPNFVLVTGQVLNSTAISYRPGKSAKWYLSEAGGPTQLADKKSIMVIRADGSVMGAKNGMWSGESFSTALEPGDTIVVPERVFSGGLQWQSLFSAAQVASSVVSTVFIALHY
jgi:polysaccharide biosynthesis/export protein